MGAEERWEVGRKRSVRGGGQSKLPCNRCRTVERRAFQNATFGDCGGTLRNTRCRWAARGARDSLDVDVGADDILDLLGERVLEGERAGSNPDPLSGFRAKAVHDREDLALQLHHLEQVQHGSGLHACTKTGLM